MVVRQLASNEGGRRRGAGGDGGDGGSSRYDRRGWNVTAVQVHAGAGGFICRQNTTIFRHRACARSWCMNLLQRLLI